MGIIYVITFLIALPMLIVLINKVNKGKKISTGFKVCTLIFCNLILGIVLLVNHDL